MTARSPTKRFAPAAAWLISAMLLVACALGGAAQRHVVIMHTNDIHGHLLPDAGAGGLAMIATIVRNVHPDLLLDGGDMFSGTLVSDTFAGEPVLAVMNHMGYGATTIGNHEFDYGLDALRARARESGFPFLSANVVMPIPEIGMTTVLQVDGIRFGVVGLTTEETPETTHPKNLKSVQILDVVKSLEQVLPQLRSRSDFIVVLAHLTPEEELRVARAFPEIGLIVGGHNHTELRQPIREKNTMIVRTSKFGAFVGQVDIDFMDKAATQMSARLIPVTGVDPDPETLRIVAPYQQKVDAQLNMVIGQSTGLMPYSGADQSPIANLIADAFRAKTGTRVAIGNIGGIRASLREGVITYGSIYEILPFENTLVTLKVTGAQLKRILSRDIAAISGVRAVFDLRKPKDSRLVSAVFDDGAPIIDSNTYSITVNDFMQAGGDGYADLANATDIVDTGIRLRDVVSEYIAARKTISPVIDGRVRVLK